MIRLYGYWSTNPQKVRLALEALALPYTLVEVDLFKGEHRAEAFGSISPRNTVPALEIDDVVLWESGAILVYLGQREGRLWPSSAAGRAKALNLLFMESAAFQEHAGVAFFNRGILPRMGKTGDSERVAKAHQKLAPILRVLSEAIGEQPYLMGPFSLVDCAYAPWLPWIDLDDFPNLAAWRDRLQARPEWKTCGVVGPD
jgi:glutathione S-transferase